MPLVKVRKRYQVTIPREIRKALSLEEGDYLEVETNEQGILLKPMKAIFTKKQSLHGLVDQFIIETRKELGHLNPTDAWNDQMTVGQYLALSEEVRDQLWEESFAQAQAEMENVEEIDADADYIPAGQRDS